MSEYQINYNTMLNIYFGETEGAMHGPSWFRFNFREEWFGNPLVAEMMEDIDKSHYRGGQLIESDVLGPIPLENMFDIEENSCRI